MVDFSSEKYIVSTERWKFCYQLRMMKRLKYSICNPAVVGSGQKCFLQSMEKLCNFSEVFMDITW